MSKRLVISACILFAGFVCCFAACTGSTYAQTVLPGPGIINTVAGNGTAGFSGDGAAATSAELNGPGYVAVDADGNMYISDSANCRIRKVTVSTGDISTVAGNGTCGYSGDGAAATSAEISPAGVAVDAAGNIYIADSGNNRIRKVTVSTGDISTVAGNGTQGYSGDGGAATSAELFDPLGVAVDATGNIYIADLDNQRIRKVTISTGHISTVAGNGTNGYSGDGGAATSAELFNPDGVALDTAGNIYIVDNDNERIRKVTVSTGDISTVAGGGASLGDGGPATSAELFNPTGVAVDTDGNIYIADLSHLRIRKVTVSTGIITTVAGNGTRAYSGDGGAATSAELDNPSGVAVDTSGNIYITDDGNNRVRVVGSVFPSAASVVTGTPPFGSFSGGPDIVNLSNLNVHITIPLISKPGRGTPFTYNLSYDSSVWSTGDHNWTLVPNAGWHVGTEPTTGYVSDTTSTAACGTGNLVTSTSFVFHDMYGVAHPFTGSTTQQTGACGSTGTNLNTASTDGSGYSINVTGTGAATITSRMGKVITPPFNGTAGAGTFKDANGNEISVNGSGVFTDTLGTTALTVSGTAPSPVTFTYTAPSGASASYTMKYTSHTVETSFGCGTVTDYPATTKSLVSEIDLPDGTSYTFTYEPTPGHSGAVTGRLASYTLPTGGTISYTYTNGSNGIECSDGSAAGLDRTTPDGAWTYVRTLGTAPATSTTITDPQSNKTVLNFQGIYETERQIYQGASTLLKTIFTCYNGNVTTSTCNSTAISLPISEISVFPLWPGTGGLESRTSTFYNSYGLVTEKDEYAYGAGSPGAVVRKTLTTYASLSNGIMGKPATVTVEDGSSSVKAKTTYCYDEGTPSGTATCAATGAPTATSGTPQHVSITGSRGNTTTIASLVQGTTTLGKKYTYYDTGTVNAATDVNGAVTTYTYGSGTSCGNSFPTSVSEPLSLSRSMTWNCTGGLATSVTDENSQVVSTTYNDPDFWRPNAFSDQESNVTNMTYTGATSVEESLVFNTNSTTDLLKNLDSLGRTQVSQRKESPSSTTYDSVETDYDSLGRPSRTTLPYAGTAGQTNPSAPGISTTYDALNRKLQVTDSGGRTTTFTYSQNDTYRTVGPAPAGENTKQKQFEYDAQRRLTSVCEVTSVTGSGTCGQTNSATGYWTQYTYNLLNHLIGVTQNAQSGSTQTRTYAYDDLGRMTSETNPESGTTTYTYDTDSTCGTSSGDLVKKVDAVSNTTCYAYDALHRPTSVTYSGSYASVTANKYFVYDAATVNSVAMTNVKARMAEAYTTAGSSTATKLTDEGFSYTVRGEGSDVYESTPNSGMYYHIGAAYWANGVPSQLTNNLSTHLPTFTYGPDGEGRINTISASSGQNPVTGTTYNVASLPTAVTLGSTDSDSFTYDSNTNRTTQYEFTVGGQSVVGALTWNAIGTLEDLVVTDPFFSGGNQSCAYTHDDLSRIASANCGSVWSQTFSYDAFGNVDKSGTISFLPTYSYLTNQITMVGSSTPTYDANGNATNDTSQTYAWDAAGHAVTINSTGLTYDALGRMAEQAKGTNHFQIVYTPMGNKFAIMKGSTLSNAFVPLTGGAQAVYIGSGLDYYRHSDWLGSTRFDSNPNQTMYSDGAYAPFGESYAQTGTADLSFTGMNNDTVTNLYDFPAREYSPIQGRWPSPDPAGISSVHLRDPQTWNRYAYVRNNPLKMTDPSGMDPDPQDPGDLGQGDCVIVLECSNDSGGCTDYVRSDCGANGTDSGGNGTGTSTSILTDDNGNGFDNNGNLVQASGNPCYSVCNPDTIPTFNLTFSADANSGFSPEDGVAVMGMLSNTDANIGEIYGTSLVSGGLGAGCAGMGMVPCANAVIATVTATSLFLNAGMNTEPATGPETGHNPDEGPDGGYIGPEPAPISGPPTPP